MNENSLNILKLYFFRYFSAGIGNNNVCLRYLCQKQIEILFFFIEFCAPNTLLTLVLISLKKQIYPIVQSKQYIN